MALPVTFAIEPTQGVEVTIQKINQDNNGVTYFNRMEDGSELKMTIKRSYQGKKLGGQIERHSIDMTHTEFNAEGIPIVTQSYTHILVERGQPAARAVQIASELARIVVGRSVEILNWET